MEGPAAPTPRNKGLPLRFRQNYTESVGFLQIKGQVLPSLSPIPWSYSWYDRGSARRSSPDRIAGGASSASAFSWRLFDPGGTIPPGPHWVLPMPRGDPDRPLIAGFAREKQQADDDLIARASGESRRESETEDYGLNRSYREIRRPSSFHIANQTRLDRDAFIANKEPRAREDTRRG